MMAEPSLLVSIATSLHTSEAQLKGHGQVGTGTGAAHPCAGLWALACMQREGVLTAPAQSQDSLALISEPCGL